MSKYDLEQLIKMWALEQLTAEQAIGQILLQVRDLLERVSKLERTVRIRSGDAPPSVQGD